MKLEEDQIGLFKKKLGYNDKMLHNSDIFCV